MTQTTYTIREMLNAQSFRGESGKITSKSLSGAKIKASKMQMFQGTVLIIENEDGARLAIKEGKAWTNF
jgi:hypothetical protein